MGYRFHPTDKQLIDHYLWNKALDRDSAVQAIGEVVGDLCDWEPGELTGKYPVHRIFFSDIKFLAMSSSKTLTLGFALQGFQ